MNNVPGSLRLIYKDAGAIGNAPLTFQLIFRDESGQCFQSLLSSDEARSLWRMGPDESVPSSEVPDLWPIPPDDPILRMLNR